MEVTKIRISDDAIIKFVCENNINYIVIKDTKHIERSTRSTSPEEKIIKVFINSKPNAKGVGDTLENIFKSLEKDLRKYGRTGKLELLDKENASIEYGDHADADEAVKHLQGKIYTDKYGHKIQIDLGVVYMARYFPQQ